MVDRDAPARWASQVGASTRGCARAAPRGPGVMRSCDGRDFCDSGGRAATSPSGRPGPSRRGPRAGRRRQPARSEEARWILRRDRGPPAGPRSDASRRRAISRRRRPCGGLAPDAPAGCAPRGSLRRRRARAGASSRSSSGVGLRRAQHGQQPALPGARGHARPSSSSQACSPRRRCAASTSAAPSARATLHADAGRPRRPAHLENGTRSRVAELRRRPSRTSSTMDDGAFAEPRGRTFFAPRPGPGETIAAKSTAWRPTRRGDHALRGDSASRRAFPSACSPSPS